MTSDMILEPALGGIFQFGAEGDIGVIEKYVYATRFRVCMSDEFSDLF